MEKQTTQSRLTEQFVTAQSPGQQQSDLAHACAQSRELSLKETALPSVTQTHPPIECLMENGFSIFRLSEIDKSIPATGRTHEFLVRNPEGDEVRVTVQIAQTALAVLRVIGSEPLTIESKFWLTLAERHLVAYLFENDDCPANALLTVERLDIDDMDLARRWDREV